MERDNKQLEPMHPSVKHLLLVALSAANLLEESSVLQTPDLGRSFNDENLEQKFHQVRAYHTLGRKAPSDGKKGGKK